MQEVNCPVIEYTFALSKSSCKINFCMVADNVLWSSKFVFLRLIKLSLLLCPRCTPVKVLIIGNLKILVVHLSVRLSSVSQCWNSGSSRSVISQYLKTDDELYVNLEKLLFSCWLCPAWSQCLWDQKSTQLDIPRILWCTWSHRERLFVLVFILWNLQSLMLSSHDSQVLLSWALFHMV